MADDLKKFVSKVLMWMIVLGLLTLPVVCWQTYVWLVTFPSSTLAGLILAGLILALILSPVLIYVGMWVKNQRLSGLFQGFDIFSGQVAKAIDLRDNSKYEMRQRIQESIKPVQSYTVPDYPLPALTMGGDRYIDGNIIDQIEA